MTRILKNRSNKSKITKEKNKIKAFKKLNHKKLLNKIWVLILIFKKKILKKVTNSMNITDYKLTKMFNYRSLQTAKVIQRRFNHKARSLFHKMTIKKKNQRRLKRF